MYVYQIFAVTITAMWMIVPVSIKCDDYVLFKSFISLSLSLSGKPKWRSQPQNSCMFPVSVFFFFFFSTWVCSGFFFVAIRTEAQMHRFGFPARLTLFHLATFPLSWAWARPLFASFFLPFFITGKRKWIRVFCVEIPPYLKTFLVILSIFSSFSKVFFLVLVKKR